MERNELHLFDSFSGDASTKKGGNDGHEHYNSNHQTQRNTSLVGFFLSFLEYLHENVQYIMNMSFFKAIADTLSCEIRMTTHVTFSSRHEFVGVRIAARTDHVVDSGPVVVEPVGDGIVRDGGQRS